MLSENIKPNTATLNAVLHLYTECLRINRALEFREKFKEHGLTFDLDTYKSYIKLFTRTKQLERAFDFFNLMKAENIKPDLQTYAHLVFGCARNLYITSGLRLMREMKENGIPVEPHFHFVVNFRRNITKTPHLVKELDEITGKAEHFVPGWKKPRGRKRNVQMREMTKEERQKLASEPKFLNADQVARSRPSASIDNRR
eukprot:TRINITY_DN2456_c0_g1_i5.p1 TRINITY_DN2456_c0_g1~~TRINITY_DN2456_c0_g1_i5.p1  ORF type:complete len:200 (-),score=24.58 TRINITY_DN2456_c0_g1_i5:46-645(-)